VTSAEARQRIAEVKRLQGEGFYIDAVEAERDLYRDLGEDACRCSPSDWKGEPYSNLSLALRELRPPHG
jgi:hypothetical protein